MEKLLAALSLPQVGAINTISPSEDPEGKEGLFALELNSRMYTLRAKSDAEAKLWVSALSRLREQGIQAAQKEADSRVSNAKTKLSLEVDDQQGASQANWIKSSSVFTCCC